MTATEASEWNHVAALLRVRVQTSDWFGAAGAAHAGPVCALIAVGPAGTTVAAESHGVGEDRVGVDGAAGQHGRAVFHLVVGTTSLDEEAWAEYIPQVAVLLTAHKHMSGLCVYVCIHMYIFDYIVNVVILFYLLFWEIIKLNKNKEYIFVHTLNSMCHYSFRCLFILFNFYLTFSTFYVLSYFLIDLPFILFKSFHNLFMLSLCLYDNISMFFFPPEETNDNLFLHHKGHTHPRVAKSHADGRVDRHTEVTLWPLHMQGEVSG